MDSTLAIIIGVLLGAISSFCSSYANVLMKISHIRKMKEFYNQEQNEAKEVQERIDDLQGAPETDPSDGTASPVVEVKVDIEAGANDITTPISPTSQPTISVRDQTVHDESPTLASETTRAIVAAGDTDDSELPSSPSSLSTTHAPRVHFADPPETTEDTQSSDTKTPDKIVVDAELAKAMSKFGDSLWYNEKAPASHSSNCCLWFSVLLLYAGNVLFRFVALALVPLSTIAPTSALTIACNILLARYYFRERMSRTGFFGTFLVVLGCVLAIAVGQKEEESLPLEDLLKLFRADMFVYFIIIYSGVFFVSLVYMMYIKGTIIRIAIWIAQLFPSLDKILLNEEEAMAAEAQRRASAPTLGLRSKSATDHSPTAHAKTSDDLLDDTDTLADPTHEVNSVGTDHSTNIDTVPTAASVPNADGSKHPQTLLDILPLHYSLPIVAPGFSLVPFNPATQAATTTTVAGSAPTTSALQPITPEAPVSGSLSQHPSATGASGSERPQDLNAEVLVDGFLTNPPKGSPTTSVTADSLSQTAVTGADFVPLPLPGPRIDTGALPPAALTSYTPQPAEVPRDPAPANVPMTSPLLASSANNAAPSNSAAGQNPSATAGLASTILALPSYMSNVVGGLVEGMARTAVQFDVLGSLEISRSRAMSRAEGPSADAIYISQRAAATTSPFLGARSVGPNRLGSADDACVAAATAAAKRRQRLRRRHRQNDEPVTASAIDPKSDVIFNPSTGSIGRRKGSIDSKPISQSSHQVRDRVRHPSMGSMGCEDDDPCVEDDTYSTSDGYSSHYGSALGRGERIGFSLEPQYQSICESKHDPLLAMPTPVESVPQPNKIPSEVDQSQLDMPEIRRSASTRIEDHQLVDAEEEEQEEDEDEEDDITSENTMDDDSEVEDGDLDEAHRLDIYAATELREKLATKRMRSLTPSQRRLFALALAYMGSYTAAWMNLTGKAAMAMLKATFSGDNQFVRWEAYFILIGLVVSVVSSLKLMSFMMSHFPALYIVPIYQCLFIIGLILVGVFFFDEFSTLTAAQMIPFIVAILICFVGIYLITYSHAPEDKDDDAKTKTKDQNSDPEKGDNEVEHNAALDTPTVENQPHDHQIGLSQIPPSVNTTDDSKNHSNPVQLQQVTIHIDG